MIAQARAYGDDRAVDMARTSPEPTELRLFHTIPPRFGLIRVEYDSVMFREGEVAVFDEMWTSGRGQADPLLSEDGIYVIEYQRPFASTSWEDWEKSSREYGRTRLDVSRSMVRVARSNWRGCEDKWMIHPLARAMRGVILCSDGPLDEYNLAHKIIGKVVGIYRSDAFGLSESQLS